MNIKEIIRTLFSHVFSRAEHSSDRRGLNPVRDWLLGIFMFLVLLSIGGLFSAYQFLQYLDVSVGSQNSNQKIQSYNKATVEGVSALYAVKKQEFILLKQNSIKIPAPIIEVPVSTTTPVSIPAPIIESNADVSTTTPSNANIQMAN